MKKSKEWHDGQSHHIYSTAFGMKACHVQNQAGLVHYIMLHLKRNRTSIISRMHYSPNTKSSSLLQSFLSVAISPILATPIKLGKPWPCTSQQH
jgi:hypothetical protein